MISAVILTKNEENSIKDCLQSLLWCDEIVIIDDYSTDRTIQIIKSLKNSKIQITQRKLEGDFSNQRNYAFLKTKGEWILFVDADEIVSTSLQYEILNTVNSNVEKKNGYFIRRKDFMWGKTINHGESYTTKFLRLAQRDTGTWHGRVHETWKVKGSTGVLKNFLIHYPHKSVADFLKELNAYTTIRAKELYGLQKKVNSFSIVMYPLGKFIQNYIVRRGFLDGIVGLILAIMMSFHSFLVRGKLWYLWQNDKKRLET